MHIAELEPLVIKVAEQVDNARRLSLRRLSQPPWASPSPPPLAATTPHAATPPTPRAPAPPRAAAPTLAMTPPPTVALLALREVLAAPDFNLTLT